MPTENRSTSYLAYLSGYSIVALTSKGVVGIWSGLQSEEDT